MNNLELLKQELLKQKEAIINKGGNVNIKNLNPSPAEITDGINNLSIPNFSSATASPEDVLEGKTFYAQDSTIKVGSYVSPSNMYNHLYVYNENEQTSESSFNYAMPSYITKIRPYLCSGNKNFINFAFNDLITEIGVYAFSGTVNFVFENFAELSQLTTIGSYSFQDSNPNGLNLQEIPSSVTKFDIRCFSNMVKDGDTINIPITTTTINNSAFSSDEVKYCKSLNLNELTPLSILSSQSMLNLRFDCDLSIPATVTQVASKYNYNGSFNNITINGKTSLAAQCFSADSTVPLSEIKLKTVTFKSQTPPTVVATAFATQALSNGLKIYVPDESYDAYLTKLSSYSDFVYPVSQKE